VSLAMRNLCNTLIRRSIDLDMLYRLAASQVSEPGLRVVLQENAMTLDQVIAELQMLPRASGTASVVRGSRRAAMRRMLMRWWVRHTVRHDSTWIHILARSESALLVAFEHAISRGPRELALLLQRQSSRLNCNHLDMHSLAKAVRQ